MTEQTNAGSRVAIVTGGSRGIGAEVAKRLARDGQSVVIVYAGRVDDANEVVAGIVASGGRALAVKADIADESLNSSTPPSRNSAGSTWWSMPPAS